MLNTWLDEPIPIIAIAAITPIRTNSRLRVERRILATKPATIKEMEMAAWISKKVSTRLEPGSALTIKEVTMADAKRRIVKIIKRLENKTLTPSVMMLTI